MKNEQPIGSHKANVAPSFFDGWLADFLSL